MTNALVLGSGAVFRIRILKATEYESNTDPKHLIIQVWIAIQIQVQYRVLNQLIQGLISVGNRKWSRKRQYEKERIDNMALLFTEDTYCSQPFVPKSYKEAVQAGMFPSTYCVAELGTRKNCRDNVTMFSGQTIVEYCITVCLHIFVVATPFTHEA